MSGASRGQRPLEERNVAKRSEATKGGAHTGGATPVPIPNTVVKPFRADGTALARVWESRSVSPLLISRTSFVSFLIKISFLFFLKLGDVSPFSFFFL